MTLKKVSRKKIVTNFVYPRTVNNLCIASCLINFYGLVLFPITVIQIRSVR